MAKTSVSIVTHNTPMRLLERLLDSLKAEDIERTFIIDNSDIDNLGSQLALNEHTEYLHVANNGYGAGHNIALRKAMEAGYDYHLVVNPDVRWDGNIIGSLVEYMESHPEVGQIMPLTVYPDGTLQYVCRRLPYPIDMILRLILPDWIAKKRRKKYLRQDADYQQIMQPRYMLGSFMLFRVTALEEIGLFDERFFMYPEDIDITRRMHERYATVYYPHVKIIHDHARASHHNIKMMWIHIFNMIKYFNKWGWLVDKERKLDWKN